MQLVPPVDGFRVPAGQSPHCVRQATTRRATIPGHPSIATVTPQTFIVASRPARRSGPRVSCHDICPRFGLIVQVQERYGEWVLLDPPPRGRSLLLWAAPLIVAIGALALVIFRVRAAPTQERTELSPDEMALVEAAVDQRRRQIGDDVAEDDQP